MCCIVGGLGYRTKVTPSASVIFGGLSHTPHNILDFTSVGIGCNKILGDDIKIQSPKKILIHS